MIVSLIILSSLYFLRAPVLVPIMQKYIHTKTGYDIGFDNFYFLPFNRLTFINLRINDIAVTNKITFEINPVKLFAHITSPVNCISKINISKLKIYVNKNKNTQYANSGAFALPNNKKNFIKFLKSADVKVYVDELIVSKKFEFVKIINTNILINQDKIILDSFIYTAGIPIKLSSQIVRTADNLFDTSSLLTAKQNKTEIYINWGGTIDLSSLRIVQNISIKKLRYHGFNLDDSFCSFLKTAKSYDINLTGKFGIFYFGRSSDSMTKVMSRIDISKINKNMSGNVKLDFEEQDSSSIYGLELNVTNLVVFGLKNGDFKLSGAKNNTDIYKFFYMYGTDKKMEIIYAGGAYEKKIIVKNKIIGTVMRNNGMYAFNLYKDDNSIVFNFVVKNGKIISTDFKFVGVDILNILRVLRVCGWRTSDNISGTANGSIKYKKDSITEFDIKAFKGTLYGNKFKKLEIKGNVNLSRINIEHFRIANNSNKSIVDMNGLLGFSKENSVSFLHINANNISVGAVTINGHAEFHGYLTNNNCIKGVIKSTGMAISGLSLGNISADTIISTKKIEISSLKSDNGIEAFISANFKENKLSGRVNFVDTNIRRIYQDTSGFLNSCIKFSGELNNPDIDISASITKGQYLSIPFSFVSKLRYKDSVVIVNKAVFSSSKSSVALHGKFNDTGLSLVVDNLNEKIINTIIGFKTPLRGNFSGTGIVSVRNWKYNCKLWLTAKIAYIKTVKFNNIKSNIEISNESVVINGASAKILDSEIRVNEGFFNIRDTKYKLDLFLVNVHASRADLFGNVKLSGIMTKEKGKPVYSGIIDLNNLWVNKYKLSSYCINYTVRDKTLEFFQKTDCLNTFNSSGLIVFGDVILIKKLNILKDKTSFNLFADFSNDFFNIIIKSSNLNWRFVTNVLNLPHSINGNVDINVNLSGNVDDPKGNISMLSVSGSLMDIPYDNFNVEIDFHDNRAYVKKAFVFKRNEMGISVHGDFPFYFNKTLAEKMNREPVNISYVVNDCKLNILKYLSNGFIKPCAGKMLFNGAFTGTYEKINNNGNFSISGGVFDSNDYFNKVKNMFVEMSLIGNLIKIDKFNLKSGSGKLNVYGQLKLENFSIKNFDIRIVTDNKGVPLRIPQLAIPSFMGSKSLLVDYSSGEPVFDIKIQGTRSNPKISGYIVLENTRFTFPGKTKNKDSLLPENAEFNLKLISAKSTRFENSYVSALINGSLYIKGHHNDIKTYGVIETSNGRIDYLGMMLDILSAKVEIIDNKQIYITALGETVVPSKTGHDPEIIQVSVKRSKLSELSRPATVRFTSKDDTDTGVRKDFEKITGTEQGICLTSLQFEESPSFVMKQQALRLFDQTLATPLTRAILRKTRFVDDFRVSYIHTDGISIDKNLTLANLLSGTKYSLEKKLTNQILIGYSITFNEFNVDEINKKLYLRHGIGVKYKLANNLYLDGSFELNSEEETYQPERRLMLQYQLKFAPSTKIKINKMQRNWVK
jgi:hypothetical protein